MRRFKPLLTTALALMAVCMFSAAARASIIGSKHDFGGDEYKNWSKGEICLPCHIPHNATVKDASGNDLDGPLWNHTLSTATYTLYDALTAPTVDASGNPVLTGEVDNNSILCLSCHDGTVALDSFGGGLGTAGPIAGTPGAKGSANLGTDLSDDHPIGEKAIWPDTTPSYMVDPSLRNAQAHHASASHGGRKAGRWLHQLPRAAQPCGPAAHALGQQQWSRHDSGRTIRRRFAALLELPQEVTPEKTAAAPGNKAECGERPQTIDVPPPPVPPVRSILAR